MRLRLCAIRYGCDFRQNEVTQWNELRKDPRFKQVGQNLRPGDTVLLVSSRENQMIWLFPTAIAKSISGKDVQIMDSRRTRLLSCSWHPGMLQEYARQAGIELVGMSQVQAAYSANKQALRDAKKGLSEYEPHTYFSKHMSTV